MSSLIKEQVLRPLPLGNSNFSKLRELEKIYVDKTAMLFELARSDNKIFLARPRRFGKSLLVSTFYSLFKFGLRDFKGLAIENLWKEKKEYKVIALNFSRIKSFTSGESFQRELDEYLLEQMQRYCLIDENIADKGCKVFRKWLEHQPNASVVLLIDEYDSPLTDCLGDPKTFMEVRGILSTFYSVLKDDESPLRFLFITGITKFSNAGIFSHFNDLEDISLVPDFGTIVGYTLEELEYYFEGYLKRASEVLDISKQDLLKELIVRYNGFCFEETAQLKVFAPWSILNFFNRPKRGFRNYWYESAGQPGILLHYIKDHALLEPSEYATEKSLSIAELSATLPSNKIDEIVLLTQTGYLTIKRSVNDILYLGYPNQEVANSMAVLYLSRFLRGKTVTEVRAMNLPLLLARRDVKSFVECLNSAFLSLDYDHYFIDDEKKCLDCLVLVLYGSGVQARIESHNALGRSDVEFSVAENHWVLELKFARKGQNEEKLLAQGIEQVKSRHYGEQSFRKNLIRLVMVFSEKERSFVKYALADK